MTYFGRIKHCTLWEMGIVMGLWSGAPLGSKGNAPDHLAVIKMNSVAKIPL